MTSFTISVRNSKNYRLHFEQPINRESIFVRRLKETVSFVGLGSLDRQLFREEYHLTPKDGVLQSEITLLNGTPLELTKDGEIPDLKPYLVDVDTHLTVAPLSIKFVVFPNFDAPACV